MIRFVNFILDEEIAAYSIYNKKSRDVVILRKQEFIYLTISIYYLTIENYKEKQDHCFSTPFIGLFSPKAI